MLRSSMSRFVFSAAVLALACVAPMSIAVQVSDAPSTGAAKVETPAPKTGPALVDVPVEPAKPESPVKTEGAKAAGEEAAPKEPVKTETGAKEKSATEPAKGEPVKTEPAKGEPTKTDPATKSDPTKSAPPVKPEAKPTTEPATKTAQPATKPLNRAERNIRFQFDGIPYTDVVRRFSQMSGRPLLAEAKIEGTLTFFDAEPYTYDEAMDTLNVLLAIKGVMMVESGRYLQVVPLSDAALKAKILAGLDEAKQPQFRPGEVVTVMLPVHHLDVETASKAIVPMVSVFGRIAPVPRGKGVLLTDTVTNLQRIRTLLTLMDQKAEDETKLDLRSYQLKKASASNAANMVNNLLRGGSRSYSREGSSGGPPSTTTRSNESVIYASADERANILLLRGTKDMLELAEQLLKLIDTDAPSGEQIKVFTLTTAGAKDVAAAVLSVFYRRGGSGEGSRADQVFIYGDATMNSVLVRANIEDMPVIEDLIKKLDQQVKAFNSIKAFPLKAASAASIADVLTRVLAPRDSAGSRIGTSVAVSVDSASNIIYVSGPPYVIEMAEKTLKDIDRREESGRELHALPIKDADVTAIATALAATYEREYGKSGAALAPVIQAIPASNSLLVSCTQAQWEQMKPLVEQLTKAAIPTNIAVTKIVPLKHAKAAELAETLKQVFVAKAGNAAISSPYGARSAAYASSYGRRSSDGESAPAPVVIAPSTAADAAIIIVAAEQTNSLVISADEEHHTKVADLIKLMDVEPTEKADPIQIVRLQSADAARLAQTLTAMVPAAAGKAASVFIQPDVATNSVLLRAPESERKALETLIASLDKDTKQNAREQRLVQLKFVSASALAPMLTQLYMPATARDAAKAIDNGEQVIIAAAPGDKTLVVDAPLMKVEQIARLVASMDTENGPAQQQVRTYLLANSNARELAGNLARLFAADVKSAAPGAELPPRFEADGATNQLIVSATQSQFTAIEKLVKDLEKETLNATQTRTFRLKFAKAEEVVTVIQSMLLDSAGGAAAAAKNDRIVRVAALAATNDIVVQGPPDKLALAEQLIKTFDDEHATKGAVIQTVFLKNAQAASLADAVQTVINGKVRPGAVAGEEVVVTADPNSNSVLVRGPASLALEATEMIKRLDSQSETSRTQMKVYRLENGDPAAMAKTVEALFKSIIAQQSSGKGMTPPPFSVAADERTRSLVISTTSSYFTLVEQLLLQLDQSQERIERKAEIHRLVNAKASDVWFQLDSMYADRKGEDKPVIDYDPASNTVTAIGKEQDLKQIAEVVAKVDEQVDNSLQVVVIPMKQLKAGKMANVLKTVYEQTNGAKVIVTDKLPAPGEAPVPKKDEPEPKKDDAAPLKKGPSSRLDQKDNFQFSIFNFQLKIPSEEDIAVSPRRGTSSRSVIETASRASQAGAEPVEMTDLAMEVAEASAEAVDTSPFTPYVFPNDVRRMALNVAGEVTPATQFALAEPEKDKAKAGAQPAPVKPAAPAPIAPAVVAPVGNPTIKTIEVQPGADGKVPDVVIAVDEASNSLIISGTRKQIDEMQALLTKLAGDTTATDELDFRVYPIKNADPEIITQLLNSLFNPRLLQGANMQGINPLQQQLFQMQQQWWMQQPGGIPGVGTVPGVGATGFDAGGDTGGGRRAGRGGDAGGDPLSAAMNFLNQGQGGGRNQGGQSGGRNTQGNTAGGGRTQQQQQVLPTVALVADKRTNRVIARGKPADLDLIGEVIKQLDTSTTTASEVRIFPLKNTDAREVATNLTDMFVGSRRTGATGSARSVLIRGKIEKKIQEETGSNEPVDMSQILSIGANQQTNSVIVTAPGVVMGIVAEVIEELDQTAANASVPSVRMYPVKNADVSGTVANLRQIFAPLTTGTSSTGGQGRVVITADAAASTIIVAASPDQHKMIAEVIKDIDKAQPGDELSIVVYRINNVDASSVSGTLNEMILGGGAGARVNNIPLQVLPGRGGRTTPTAPGAATSATAGAPGAVRITADASANAIVVRAAKEQHEQIKKLIEELDVAVASQQPVQLIALKHADPVNIAQILNKVFSNQQQNQIRFGNFSTQQRQAIVIDGDRDAKVLIVGADEKSFEKISEMAKQLDVASPAGQLTQKIVQLEHAQAASVAVALTDAFAAQQRGAAGGAGNVLNRAAGGGVEDVSNRVTVVAEPVSNSVIVTANEENHAKIDLLIAKLDTSRRGGLTSDVLSLKNAKAADLAKALKEVAANNTGVRGTGRAGTSGAMTETVVSADPSTNTILFSGPAAEVTKLRKMAEDLDISKNDVETGVTVIPIKNGDAVKMAATVRNLFNQVALNSGFNMGPTSSKFAIEGDAGSNSLIVVAGTEMLSQLRFTINHLELVAPQRGQPRIIALKYADPNEFQRVIYSIYGGQPDQTQQQGGTQQGNPNQGNNQGPNQGNNQGNRGGNQGNFQPGGNPTGNPGGARPGGNPGRGGANPGGGLIPRGPASDRGGTTSTVATTEGRVTATPLPSNRSVIVNASDEDLAAILKLAEAMDKAAEGTKRSTKVVILKNANNTRVAQSLNTLFLSTARANVPEDRVSVTALAGTQAVVVAAVAEKMAEVEALIAQLDDKAVTPQVEFRVYPVKNTSPTKMLPLMQRMMTKVEEIKQDPSVDVQADERTRSIIVTAKTNVFDSIGKIIDLLDTAPAHEKADVMIVQLKRADATRMANVINSMLRPSADAQITPEAKALQEQVRVLTVADDKGQRKIELDLTKPIKVTADPLQTGEQGSNALLISSTKENLQGLVQLVQLLDQVPLTEAVKVQLVLLKTADAEAVARTLTEIFTQGQKLSGKPGTSTQGKAEPETDTGKALVNPLNVSSDARTNTLVLSGRAETLELAVQITKDLDREAGKFVTEVKLFTLSHAKASAIAPILSEVFAESQTTGGGAGAAGGAGGNSGIEGMKTQVTRLRTVLSNGKTIDSETAKSRPALTIRADDTTQTLVVAARSDVMPLIADVVKTLDVPGAGAGNLVRFMPLENADATRIKALIDSLYTGANAKDVRPTDVPTVGVDTRTNTLVITTSEKTYAVISAMLKQVDKKLPIELKEIRLVKLKNAQAATLAPVLQKAMDDRVARQQSLGVNDAEALKVLVTADDRSNSLIIGGSNEGYKLVESIAMQLDDAGPALGGQIQIVSLKNAVAGQIATTLTTLFDQRYAAATATDVKRQKPVILADARSNMLLISANGDDSKVLEGLLMKMDVKLDDPAVGIYVIGMKHNDSSVVGPAITRLFTAREASLTPTGQQPVPQNKVSVETDSLSNALIIAASKENMLLIQGLLAKLDVEPSSQTGAVRMYALQNSDATRVSTMLKNLATQGFIKPGGTTSTQNAAQTARDKVSIEVDTRTNVVIVSASKENFAVIEEIIKQIDSSKDFGALGDVRMYLMKNADATRLGPTLQQLFDAKLAAEKETGTGAGARALKVSFIADARTNTLMVAGSKESFAAVEQMIQQLDGQQVPAASEFRIFKLEQATAAALQVTVNNLFTNRLSRGTTKDPVTVLADTRSNSLIVGASAAEMALAEALIKQLDIKGKDAAAEPRMFMLKKADALQVATTLRGVFAESATGTTAAPGGNGAVTGQAGGVNISVDERLNAVIVTAGKADMERIENLVKQLDNHTVQRITEIRVFTLTHADATELATILNDVLTKAPVDPAKGAGAAGAGRQSMLQFLDRSENGKEFIAQAIQEGVMVSADKRSNSLIVSAPLDYMPLLGRLIRSLDQTTPKKAEIQMFKLVNADATLTADILTQLFKLEAAAGTNPKAVEYTLVSGKQTVSTDGTGNGASAPFGTAEQDSLRVTVDTRTNTLFVGGGAKHVALAAQVISELDASPALERKTEVFRLRNGQATAIQTAVSGFLEQERQRLTSTMGADKIGAAQRLSEQDVSIVADPDSNSLLISASPRYFDHIKGIINKLDDPKPQVLIQVLLAEVTLDDSTDLGFEWQYNFRVGNANATLGTDFGIAPAFNQFGGLGLSVTGGDLSFFLRALQSQGKLEVLSRPQILASDNQPANINVGQRVPFVTNSQINDNGNVVNTIEYEDVGILLNVVARISDDGFVNMDINPEISSLSDSSVQVSEAVNAPIINNRSAETKVTVQDGQTIVVGGLITSSDNHREDKVPILGDIPVLGELFKSSTHKKVRTELLIILTPRVLYKPEKIGEITKYEMQRLELMKKLKLQDAGKAIDIPFNGQGPLQKFEGEPPTNGNGNGRVNGNGVTGNNAGNSPTSQPRQPRVKPDFGPMDGGAPSETPKKGTEVVDIKVGR